MMKMGKLKGTFVYLIGPIEQVDDGGNTWREMVSNNLKLMDINIFNPCKKPNNNFDENIEHKNKIKKLKKDNNVEEVHNIMKQIARYDLRMVDRSDFMIMYIDTNVHMCGSYIEFAHAHQQQKPILIVAKNGVINLPGFILGFADLNYLFNSFDDMFEYISKLDSGEVEMDRKWKILDL